MAMLLRYLRFGSLRATAYPLGSASHSNGGPVTGRTYYRDSSFDVDELKSLEERVQKFGGKLHLPQDASTTKTNLPSRTVVLAVGWAESTLKTMAKYAPIYTQLGLPYVCVPLSVVHMWSSKLGNSITSEILNSLDASLSTKPSSLVVHIFSGGGYVFFPKACDEHEKPSSLFHTKVKPACFVFDSGPPNYTYEAGAAAAKLVYQQGGMNFLTSKVATALGTLSEKLFGEEKRAVLHRALNVSRLLDLPQLYLYSEKDTVCPPSHVRKIISGQLERGREVSSYCWPDSEHVRHYLSHSEEYRQLIEAFLIKHGVLQNVHI